MVTNQNREYVFPHTRYSVNAKTMKKKKLSEAPSFRDRDLFDREFIR